MNFEVTHAHIHAFTLIWNISEVICNVSHESVFVPTDHKYFRVLFLGQKQMPFRLPLFVR